MAIVRVKTGTAVTSTGTGTVTPTLPSGAVAGNIIVALIANNPSTTPPTVSSSGGATKQVENLTGSAACTQIFTKVASGGETNIGAFTLSTGTRDMYGVLLEYSGLSGITAERTQNGGSSTAATVIPTGVTASAASAGDLVLGFEAHANTVSAATLARMAGDTSTGGTLTKLAEANSGHATVAQRIAGRVSEIIITGSGVVGHQATIGNTRAWSASIAAFTEAAGATNATATPSVIAVTTTVPAPTVIASSPHATASVSTVAVTTSVPAPSVSGTGAGYQQVTGTDTAGLTNDGTANWGNSPDRVLWWNSYKSRWDAVLPMAAPPAAGQSDWWIVSNAQGTVTTKTLADARSGARPTTVWDDTNKRLYVLMEAVGGQGGSLLSAFNYNDTADTYTVDSSVNAKDVGVYGMGGDSNTALTRTPNGYLWVASSRGGAGIVVNRSTDSGATWGTPLSLKATQADGKLGLSYFTNAGTTYVCVANGENGIAAVPGPAVYHFLYIDSTSAGWGTAANWTDNSASIPAFSSANIEADDETNLARDASENIYWVTETENIGGAGSSDEQWLLYKRTPSGTWSKVALHTYDGVASKKRPTITIDDTNSAIYVFANTDSDTNIVYKTAPLASLSSLSSASTLTLLTASGKTHRNTHPPERVTATTDLPVLCDQQTDDVVVRNVLDITSAATNATATPSVISVTTAVPAPTAQAAAKPTPSVVGVTTSVPAPSVQAAAKPTPAAVGVTVSIPAPTVRGSAIATPGVVGVTTSVPTPTVLLATNATATPSTVAVTTAVPAPQARGAAYFIQASPIPVTVSIPTPTVLVAGNATAPVGTIAATVSVPAPTAQGSAKPTPSAVGVTTAVNAPTVSGTATATPTVVGVTTSVPAPSVRGSAIPTPSIISVTTTVPTPTVSGTAIASTSTVAVPGSVQAPSIVLAGNATASPATVAVVAAVSPPTVLGSARPTPATVTAVAAVPAPTLRSHQQVVTLVVAGVAAVPGPTVRGSAIASPAAITITASVPTPTITAGGDISVGVSTIAISAAVQAPTVQGSARGTPSTIAATVAVGVPTVSSDRVATPSTVAAVAAVPSSTIRGTAVAQPPTVAVLAGVQPGSVLAGGSVTVGVNTIAVQAAVQAPTVRTAAVVTPNTVGALAAVLAPTIKGTATATPSRIAVVVVVPLPVVFGGTIGFPVAGPTQKRVLVGPNGAEVDQDENKVDALVGAPRTVLVGAGFNGSRKPPP